MPSPLDAILAPRSVAVVGASRNPRKRGYQTVRALLESRFAGAIYPVNPHGGELLGLPVAPSVRALADVPDLAFICTPAPTVAELLEECAARGVRGAVVSAVGFRESGAEGARLEEQMVAVARRTGIRVVGPNTSGVLNTALGLNLVGVRSVRAGRLALLSQSGNIGLAIMNEAATGLYGLSVYVGVGNEADVAFHEYLEYLEGDANTAAILMYVEGFREGRRFIEVARRVSEHKPIVLLKGGRSERGVASARSHTGAIAGSYPVLRAALRQGGVIEVQRSDELLVVGEVLAAQPAVAGGKGIVVLSDGGGHATLAADTLSELGLPLAALGPETRDRLRALLGPAASIENPVDVAGAADQHPDLFARAVALLLDDPATGGVLLVGLFGGYAIRFAEELAPTEVAAAIEMAALASRATKPLVVHSLYAATKSEPLRRLGAVGVPVVESLEVAARCMRAAYNRGLFLHHLPPLPPLIPPPRRTDAPGIAVARREGRTTLTEPEAREIAVEYDVALVPATFCKTADEVAAAAAEFGSPVAIKVVSPAVPHKTDAGGVALNVAGRDKAVAAFQRVSKAAAAYAVKQGRVPDLRGVLVTPMLPSPIAELIVGVRRDAQFGPVLTVGAGGVAVEVFKDSAVRGLPVGRAEVLEMLGEIRLGRVLKGYRGRPPVAQDALADLILNVGACALAHPELAELEANPVFAYADRALVVDVRAFLADVADGDGG